jgi:hypothetical protein
VQADNDDCDNPKQVEEVEYVEVLSPKGSRGLAMSYRLVRDEIKGTAAA